VYTSGSLLHALRGLRGFLARLTANWYQAIARSIKDIASGRAEDSMLVTKKIHVVSFFVTRKKAYHAPAGDSAIHRVKRPV
jgi:hypothetical protein